MSLGETSSGEGEAPRNRISRRTVAAGAAWATPAIAVAAATPAFAMSGTTLPPCIDKVEATGGTYPVTPGLWGCDPDDNSHWDFRFRMSVSANNCPYKCVRIRVYDNVRTSDASPGGRSSWVYTPTSHHELARGKYYVEHVIPIGNSAIFGKQGDVVRRASNNSQVIVLTGDGTPNDALHVLWYPGQAAGSGTPCSRPGPMAYYTVEYSTKDCGSTQESDWTNKTEELPLDPCIPMISATACRVNGSDTNHRLNIDVKTSCGLPASSFTVTRVQRNGDGSDPNAGSAIWNGSQALGPGTTQINLTSTGSGNYYWVWFHTGDATNVSRIRIARPTEGSCAGGGGCTSAPATPRGTDACRASGSTNNNSTYRYTWGAVTGATSYNVQYSTSSSGSSWNTASNVTSPWTSPTGVRRMRVQAENACGKSGFSSTEDVSYSETDACRGTRSAQVTPESPTESLAPEATTPEATTSEAAASE